MPRARPPPELLRSGPGQGRAPAARKGSPGDKGTGPWFNAARDKGSFGALRGAPGAPLRLCAGIEPQRGASQARNG